MALTGLEIFKLLPNKNCGECEVPTCLAFAMKLAAKTVEPETCPYISEEALGKLGAAQTPPIKTITFKHNNKEVAIGGETIMFRHEKTFINQPVLALEISDGLNDEDFIGELNRIESYKYERVGEQIEPEAISLIYNSGDTGNYIKKLETISSTTGKIIILSGCANDIINEVLPKLDKERIIINGSENPVDTVKMLNSPEIPVVINSDNLENLFELVTKCEEAGHKNLILSVSYDNNHKLLNNNVFLRRLSIKKDFKPAGYPVLTECSESDDILSAITGICKYSSIIILKKFTGASIFPLLTLRQNIFTDPQKPLQIDAGIYKVGEPDENSPLIVTTNFSLTYFIVSGEIENSIYPAWLHIVEAEGMSVLTAWSANKFSGEIVGKSVKESGIEEKISHKKIIIPGYVAIISGDLEDELKGWEVLIGPQEAADLPQYLKLTWK